jgi:hypothetical protein
MPHLFNAGVADLSDADVAGHPRGQRMAIDGGDRYSAKVRMELQATSAATLDRYLK